MVFEMKLDSVYFDKIKNGQKIYDIRLNDDKRKAISVGDTIVFKKQPYLAQSVKTTVVDLLHFNSFKEMLSCLPFNQIGFECCSMADAIKVFGKFYSHEDETKFGVLAIKLKLAD